MLKAGTYQSIGIDFDDPFVSIESIFEHQSPTLSAKKVNYLGGQGENNEHNDG